MCLDSDLFDDVVVTFDDVELWLIEYARYDGLIRYNQVAQYIANYDVINKIKREKRNNRFYSLNRKPVIDKENLSRNIAQFFKPKFFNVLQRPPAFR